MSEDNTEYYWDEETQSYYYWDEETQAYYAWEEEEEEESTQQSESASGSSGSLDQEVNTEEDSKLAKLFAQSTAASAPVEPEPPPFKIQESSPQVQTRGFTRNLSLADHGGLAGVLELLKNERMQRAATVKLTDEEIRVEQQKIRIRDLVAEQGLGDEKMMRRLSSAETAASVADSHSPRDYNTDAADTQEQQPVQMADVFSGARDTKFGRRASMRFGTVDFNNPHMQDKIEKMLGSTLKK